MVFERQGGMRAFRRACTSKQQNGSANLSGIVSVRGQAAKRAWAYERQGRRARLRGRGWACIFRRPESACGVDKVQVEEKMTSHCNVLFVCSI